MKIRRRKIEVGIPYLPMADIAFNLVLFFIMLAKTQDDRNQWEPARVPQVEKIGQSRITVTVDKDNKIYLNNSKVVSTTDLTGAIEKRLSEDASGNRAVQLKIHKDTLAATFEPIIEAVSQAGGEVVHVLEEDTKKQ